MNIRGACENGMTWRSVVCGMVLVGITLGGCAGDQPKAPPQPTPDQVKGSADRAFDKLKQEERERQGMAQ